MKNHKKSLRKSVLISCLFFFFLSNNAFSQNLNPNDWPHLKGYWTFQDTADLLAASVGNDLILVGNHQWVEGAFYGDTAIRIDTGSYYKCYHGIPANGGGDSVNQYTLMFDFKVLSLDRWHCFFQTDSTNSNDGECFIKHYGDSIPGTIGVGFTGYSSDSILPETWYRLVISVNLGNYYNYYLNGVLLHTGDTDDIAIDDRFALTPEILFFADNNQEDDTIDIGSIAIFDTCLTPTQIAQLGTIDPCIANPPIVDLGEDTTLCWNHTFNISIANTYKSILWSTGDTLSSISLDTTNFGTGQDTLWVKVTDWNGCTASDTMIVSFVDCSGIGELPKEKELSIYPNPSKGRFTISLNHPAMQVNIVNLSGQVIQEYRNMQNGKHSINLSEFPDGIYFIEVIGLDFSSKSKIMIIQP